MALLRLVLEVVRDHPLRVEAQKRAVEAGASDNLNANDRLAVSSHTRNGQRLTRIKADLRPFVVTADGTIRARAPRGEEVV